MDNQTPLEKLTRKRDSFKPLSVILFILSTIALVAGGFRGIDYFMIEAKKNKCQQYEIELINKITLIGNHLISANSLKEYKDLRLKIVNLLEDFNKNVSCDKSDKFLSKSKVLKDLFIGKTKKEIDKLGASVNKTKQEEIEILSSTIFRMCDNNKLFICNTDELITIQKTLQLLRND